MNIGTLLRKDNTFATPRFLTLQTSTGALASSLDAALLGEEVEHKKPEAVVQAKATHVVNLPSGPAPAPPPAPAAIDDCLMDDGGV